MTRAQLLRDHAVARRSAQLGVPSLKTVESADSVTLWLVYVLIAALAFMAGRGVCP